MTTFSDVPAANALYQQSLQIAQAVATLDANGTLTNFTVGPMTMAAMPSPGMQMGPMPPPGMPMGAPPSMGMPPGSMTAGMPVSITITDPVSPELLKALRTWLVQYEQDTLKKLSDLGITSDAQQEALNNKMSPPPKPISRSSAASADVSGSA